MNHTPPAIAAWILRRLVLGGSREALEGDLQEEFQRSRSASWYWRQVLAAVLSFPNLLRMGWAVAGAAAFAAVWVYGQCAMVSLGAHTPLAMVSPNWIPYGRPAFLFVGVLFYLVLPLAAYLAVARNLTLRALGMGLAAGALTIFLLQSVQFHLATPLNYLLAYARDRDWNVVLLLRACDLLQGSAPLLAGMLAAGLGKVKPATTAVTSGQ